MEGKVTIYIGKLPNYRVLYINDKWFNHNEYYTIIQDPEYILIKRCSKLHTPKSAHKCCKTWGKYGHTFSIVSDIPTGVYKISMQESNEDQLIISLV